MNLPDPQHAYLDALYKQATDQLDEDELAYGFETEPESHVFISSECDEPYGGFDDPEEYRDVVLQVGSRDLDAKIKHWERILTQSEAIR